MNLGITLVKNFKGNTEKNWFKSAYHKFEMHFLKTYLRRAF